MHLFGDFQLSSLRREVKSAQFGPGFHQAKAVKQGDFMPQRGPPHIVTVGPERNDRLGPRAVLGVYEDNVAPGPTARVDALIERLPSNQGA